MNFLEGYQQLVFLILLTLVKVKSQDNGADVWVNERVLDQSTGIHVSSEMPGKIIIQWNYTEDTITISMFAKTKGWFGIGFAKNRNNLNGADFVTGWVENGNASLQDRHVKGTKLVVDKVQNYVLIGGSENDTFTTISFKRKLNTCDKEDVEIRFGTTITVWAIGKMDPKNSKDDLNIQDVLTGNRSIRFLTPEKPKTDVSKAEVYELRTKNITLTSNDGTRYWCTHDVVRKTKEKHYMIGWDPVIQKENEAYVHHFIIYQCPYSVLKNQYKDIDPNGYDCLDPNMIKYSSTCITFFAGWAIGGEAERYRKDIGFPFGSETQDTYFKMEVHYNFPDSGKTIVDSSGIRLYHTKDLKPKYEAGVIPIGIDVTPFHVLPPGIPELRTIGVCQTKCLNKKLPKEGVTVFSVGFHTHLTGRKVILRRFRNGVELEPIGDYNFDFDLQGFVFLDKPFKLEQDDILVGECVYDTSGRNSTTVGNFPTKSEMCVIFLGHYPLVDLTGCLSILLPEKIYDLVGIEEVNPLPFDFSNCTTSDCPIPLSTPAFPQFLTVKKPDQYANKTVTEFIMNYKDWTPEKLKTLKDMYFEEQQAICWENNGAFYSTEKDRVMYPNDAKPFKEKDQCDKM